MDKNNIVSVLEKARTSIILSIIAFVIIGIFLLYDWTTIGVQSLDMISYILTRVAMIIIVSISLTMIFYTMFAINILSITLKDKPDVEYNPFITKFSKYMPIMYIFMYIFIYVICYIFAMMFTYWSLDVLLGTNIIEYILMNTPETYVIILISFSASTIIIYKITDYIKKIN